MRKTAHNHRTLEQYLIDLVGYGMRMKMLTGPGSEHKYMDIIVVYVLWIEIHGCNRGLLVWVEAHGYHSALSL